MYAIEVINEIKKSVNRIDWNMYDITANSPGSWLRLLGSNSIGIGWYSLSETTQTLSFST